MNQWDYFNRKEYQEIRKCLLDAYQSGTPIIPKKAKDILLGLHECNFEKLCMVIIGSEPPAEDIYYAGIPFGEDVWDQNDISPQLALFRDSIPDTGRRTEFDPSLITWAKQGVLLLHASPTVELMKPESHMDMWAPAMESLIKNLSVNFKNLAFVLLGNHALKFKNIIEEAKNGHMLIKDLDPEKAILRPKKYEYNFLKHGETIIRNLSGRSLKLKYEKVDTKNYYKNIPYGWD